MTNTRTLGLLGNREFRRLFLRWLRRAVTVRMPRPLANLLFRLPGGRKRAVYRVLCEAGDHPLKLRPGPLALIPGLLTGERNALALCDSYLADMPQKASLLGTAAIVDRHPGPLTGKRVALVAHWDPDGRLDPYVRCYVAHLQSLGFVTILATDRPLNLSADGAQGLPEGIVRRSCPGYDFTSWKAAFEALPEMYEAEELLLTNDSVFAPVGSLAPLLAAMKDVPCDFWGLAESLEYKPHLPSYFISLGHSAVASPALREFFARVDTNPALRHAVGHEVNFSLWLARHGLVPGVALPYDAHAIPESLTHLAWLPLLEAGLPLIKRKLLADNPLSQDLRQAPDVLRGRGYPVELIQSYFERRGIFTGLHFGPRGRGGVSVVMIVQHAEESALAASIDSLLGQTEEDWELIAAHEGEAPRALVELSAKDARVHMLPLPPGTSGLAALRLALARARRETVTFLEPSAVLPPASFKHRLAALGKDVGSGVVLCSRRSPGRYALFPALLVEDALPGLSGLLLKKELLHGLDWTLPDAARPVWWICGQLCLDGACVCLSEALAPEAEPLQPGEPSQQQRRALAMALTIRAGRRHSIADLMKLLRAALAGRVSPHWRPL